MSIYSKERFQPPPNTADARSLRGKLLFFARIAADLQVASVLQHLKPWLKSISGSVLEVGCGAQPYRHLLPPTCSYTGLDWDNAAENFSYNTQDTVYYSGETFPFADAIYDQLFHTEVLEHVYNASQFLLECKRVVKPGGRIFFTVPFQSRYHYIPFDYFRYTPASLTLKLAEAGYTDVRISPRGNDITVASYKFVTLVYRWFFGGLAGKLLAIMLSPLAIISLFVGQVSLRVAIGSTDDCLGYTVEATVPS